MNNSNEKITDPKKIKKILDEESIEDVMDWVFQQEEYDELYPERPIEI